MSYPWWVKKDFDGFFGLFLDNLIQLMLIVTLCVGLLKFPAALVLGTILPGAALSILLGNVAYTIQARRIALRLRRDDITALPYGINTVSLFGHVFFVMLPVAAATKDPLLAWQVGLVACFGSAVIEIAGAFVGDWVRRVTPRAALLSALAGIAVTFISMEFVFRIFERPLLAFLPLGILLLQYGSGVRLPLGIPGGLAALIAGIVLGLVFRQLGMAQPVELPQTLNLQGLHWTGGLLWELFPDDDLHRASRLEGAGRSRRLLGAQRSGDRADLLHRRDGMGLPLDPV